MSSQSKSSGSDSESSSVSLSFDDQDDIESAREKTDSDLKSDEILRNYGDEVLLDDFTENDHSIPHKPVSERFLAQVRYFVGSQASTAQVSFDISPINSAESEDKSDTDSHSSNYSSFGPSKSYSSIAEYLNSLTKKKQTNVRSDNKFPEPTLAIGNDDTRYIDSNHDAHSEHVSNIKQ